MKEFRFIITNNCNFKCYFCHKEGLLRDCPEKLNADDYAFLYRQGRECFGFSTVSITGGEPLLRMDILDIITKLKGENAKITLTTNFSNIRGKSEIGKYLHKINISLHATDNRINSAITQVDHDWVGLQKSIISFRREHPNICIGINCTLTKYNADMERIRSLLHFAKEICADINFSELYSEDKKDVIELSQIAEYLKDMDYTSVESTNARSFRYYNQHQFVKLSKILCVRAAESHNPEMYCVTHRDFFITPDAKIDICREQNREIDLYKDVKMRNVDCLKMHLHKAKKLQGTNCSFQQKTEA